MAANLGVRIGIEGGKDFITEVQRITAETRALKSAFEDVSKIKDPFDKAGAQIEVLTEAISKGEEKIRAYADQLDKASEKFGAESGQANRWREELFKAHKEVETLRQQLEQLSTTTVDIQGLGTFKRDLDTLTQSVSAFGAELKYFQSGTGLKGVFGRAEDMKDSLTNEIRAQQEVVKLLGEDYEKAVKEQGEFSQGAMELRQKVAEAQTELNKMHRELKDLPNGLQLAGQEIDKIADKYDAAGQKWTNAAKYFAPASAAAAAGLAGIAKTSMSYATQYARVEAIIAETTKTAEELATQMYDIDKAVMELDSIYDKSELMDGMEQIVRAGFSGEEALQAFNATLNVATIEQMGMGQAATGLAQSLMQFGDGADQASRYADVLAITSANSATNVAELLQALSQAAPAANAAGADIEDVALLLGLMASNGIVASRSGTAVKNMFSNMINPTDKAQTQLDKFNLSLFKTDGSLRPIPDVINNLRTSFDGMTVQATDLTDELLESEEAWEAYAESLPVSDQERLAAIVEIFGKRALPGVLAVIKAAESDYNDLASAITNADGAAQRMAKIIEDSPENQWKRLVNDVKALAIEFGDVLLPVLKDIIAWAKEWIDKFRGMDEGTKKTILTVMGITAAVAPVLGVIGSVTSGIGGLLHIGADLLGGIGSLTKFLTGGNGLASSVASVSEGISGGGGLLHGIGNLAGAIGGGAAGLIGKIGSLAAAAAPFMLKGAIVLGVVAGVAWVGKQIYDHWDQIKAWAGGLKDAVSGAWNGMINVMSGVAEKIGGIAGGIIGAIQSAAGKIGELAKGAFDAVSGIASAGVEAGRGLIQNIGNGIAGGIGWLRNSVSSAAGVISSFFHHSTPDEGPLKNDDTWMPDMMRQFADGIESNTGLLAAAAKDAGGEIEIMKTTAQKSLEDMRAEMQTLSKAIADDTVTQFGYTKDQALRRIEELQVQTGLTMKEMSDLTTAQVNQMSSDVETGVKGMQQEIQFLVKAVANDTIEQFGMTKEQATRRINELKAESSRLMAQMKDDVTFSASSMQVQVTGSVETLKNDVARFSEITNKRASKEISTMSGNVRSDMSRLQRDAYGYGSGMSADYTNGVNARIWQAAGTVKNASSSIRNTLSNLTSAGFEAGMGLAQNISNGINAGIGWVKNAVSGVAGAISSFLHHSTPDVGPLKNDDKWMPDMMSQMAQGIKDYLPMVKAAVNKTAHALSFQPYVYLPDSHTQSISMGGVSFTINAQPGQDVDEIAEAVEQRLIHMVERQQYAFS